MRWVAALWFVLSLALAGCGAGKSASVDGDADADADSDADTDSDADADADGDADADADGDGDTVCEDPINGCGYDPGCNGMLAPDGQCVCSRERPAQSACLPEATQTMCDTCLSFGSVSWFCAEIPGTGWRWQRADDVAAWSACTAEQLCDLRTCHGAGGLEVWVCNGSAWLPDAQVPEC